MGRLCDCDRLPLKGQPYTSSYCRLCWLYHNDEAYRKLWNESSPSLSPLPIPRQACIYLKEQTGEMIECPSCRGSVKIKLHRCEIYNQCSPHKELPNIAYCKTCKDYEEKRTYPKITTRNLLYHVYPTLNGVWQKQVNYLLERINLFNGKRYIAIVSGEGLDDPYKVVASFKDEIDSYVIIKNNPALREVLTFEWLWSKVETKNPNTATFYCHTKGSTKPVNDGITCHPWGEVMFSSCLDYWPYVENLLRDYPITGSFKKTGWTWGQSSWHYSGTFYWIRNKELFERNWKNVDKTWWGTETWPGVQFKEEEAATIFWKANASEMNLYDLNYWKSKIVPAWETWKEQHKNQRTNWESLLSLEPKRVTQ